MKLRIAGIVRESVVDGPGIRYVIFTQGCTHNCPSCHNPETHDLKGGYEVDADKIIEEIICSSHVKGITYSGGEPFLQAEPLVYIAKAVRKYKESIKCYSGFTFEELMEKKDQWQKELLYSVDILVDGRFKIDERDISLKFRGSRNQRIIDVKKSLELGFAVLLNDI